MAAGAAIGQIRRGSIRTRLTLLLISVMLPLAVLAGALAWQNDRMAADVSLASVIAGRDMVVARQLATIEDVRRTLTALAALEPPVGTTAGTCANVIAGVLASQPDRYIGLTVLDQAGRPVCGAPLGRDGASVHPVGALFPPSSSGPAPGSFALGTPGPGNAAEYILLPATFQMTTGVLVAEFRLGLPANADDRIKSWMLGADNRPLVGDAPAENEPEPQLLRALVGPAATALTGRAVNGQYFAYAARPLTRQLHVLTATAAQRSLDAGNILAGRLALIAALVVAALGMVVFGTNRIVVLPLHDLDEAVRKWRGGGPVDPGHVEDMPTELRELSLSFVHATQALADRESQLRHAMTQQELLMQEIHHRVKNNLQIVASLLNLQSSRIRLPEARAEFQSARDRVRALATLHRHLYAHGELHTINMRSFLIELCSQLLQGFGDGAGERIGLDIEAPELQMSSDQAVPIALIVTETVSNAIKYAFPDGRTGTIRVELVAVGDDARLIIADDGVGIPAVPTQERQGIGMQLIRGFARQLGGMLTVGEGAGTSYEIDIKVQQVRDEKKSQEHAPPPTIGAGRPAAEA